MWACVEKLLDTLYRLTILLGENMVNVERRWCFYGLFIHTCYCFWFFLSRSWRLCDGFHSPIHPTPHSKQIQVMCIHKHRCQSCRINELIYDVYLWIYMSKGYQQLCFLAYAVLVSYIYSVLTHFEYTVSRFDVLYGTCTWYFYKQAGQ